jgi:hypothetical protein
MCHDTPHAAYIRHDNGIHQLTFKDSSAQAADEIFAWAEAIYAAASHEQTVLELADLSAGLPPISYLARHVRSVHDQYARLLHVRAAFLYQSSTGMTALNTVLKLVPVNGSAVRQFHVKDREKAIAWLLNQK